MWVLKPQEEPTNKVCDKHFYTVGSKEITELVTEAGTVARFDN